MVFQTEWSTMRDQISFPAIKHHHTDNKYFEMCMVIECAHLSVKKRSMFLNISYIFVLGLHLHTIKTSRQKWKEVDCTSANGYCFIVFHWSKPCSSRDVIQTGTTCVRHVKQTSPDTWKQGTSTLQNWHTGKQKRPDTCYVVEI